MPLTYGRMMPDQEMRIRENLDLLYENIDAKDLVDYFIQEEIFDFSDAEQINGYSPDTRMNRNGCFFELLFNSGPGAFDVFLKALQSQRQGYLVEKILDSDKRTDYNSHRDPRLWIQTVPKKRQILADKDLARLCKTLGANWELAFYELGLSQPEVWRCKMNNPSSVLMQIYEALAIWRRKNQGQAHLENFVTTLSRCDGVNVDWDEMIAVAMNL